MHAFMERLRCVAQLERQTFLFKNPKWCDPRGHGNIKATRNTLPTRFGSPKFCVIDLWWLLNCSQPFPVSKVLHSLVRRCSPLCLSRSENVLGWVLSPTAVRAWHFLIMPVVVETCSCTVYFVVKHIRLRLPTSDEDREQRVALVCPRDLQSQNLWVKK